MIENLEQLKNSIDRAYNLMITVQQEAFTAGEAAIDARMALEERKTAALLDGSLAGKNETEREARSRGLFPALHERLDILEADERKSKAQVERARLLVEWGRARLRLVEAEARTMSVKPEDGDGRETV